MKQRALELAAERRATWLPVGTLIVVLLVTGAAARNMALTQENRRQASFEREVEQARDEFQRTIDSNLILLDGLRGLASARLTMNREQFHAYVSALELHKRYPGVQGLGFAWRVDRDNKARDLQIFQARGVANFHIWPERAEGDLYPIVYFAPNDPQNDAAIGFDLSADAARAEVLARASDTARAVVLPNFAPAEGGASQAQDSFLLATPFYWGGGTPKTTDDRHKLNAGYFICSYRIGALLSALPAAARGSFRFEVYDGAEATSPRLVYTSAPAARSIASPTPPARRELSVGDRTWTVLFTPLSTEAGRGPFFKSSVALLGTVIGLLLFVLLRIQLKRRAAQTHLVEERRLVDARFRQLIEQQLVGIYVIQGDRFTYVNPKMTEIFGYTAEELTSRPVLDFIAESSRALVKENIERRLSGAAETIHYELQGLRADGAVIEIEAHGGRIEENGAPAILGSLIDTTERRRATENQSELHAQLQRAFDELRQTQQVAMQQERLRAVGQMASGIAHEINNTISPISLYAESILENEPNLSERTRGFLETMQRAIDDVASTVARLREFSRSREALVGAAPVALNDVVQEALKLTRARWKNMELEHGHVIEVREELAPDLPTIVGVVSELRDAVTNIIFNATDAMPDGGTLTVRSGVLAPIGLMSKLSHSGQGQTYIEVADTGPGMDDETRRRCLEPFFTTKGERGTGLGLAMVYGVAQRHAAKIDIESTPGKGTTVRLRFSPSMVPTTAVPKPKPASTPLTGPLHILIVDDDQILLKSVRDILQRDGHTVAAMDGGQAGIDAFQEALATEPFDVVITDLGMPQVDGRKVAETVKIASPRTPVIMMTGWGQRMQAEGDVPAHVDRLLSKPCKLRELREALAECMAGREEASSKQ